MVLGGRRAYGHRTYLFVPARTNTWRKYFTLKTIFFFLVYP